MRWRGVDWIHSEISFTVQTRQHTRPHLISLGTRPMAPFPLGPIPRKTCWVLCSASLQGPESHRLCLLYFTIAATGMGRRSLHRQPEPRQFYRIRIPSCFGALTVPKIKGSFRIGEARLGRGEINGG